MSRRKAIPVADWRWFGNAGHLCVADRCRFHLCTRVGEFMVSTVGEFFLNPDDRKPTKVGMDRLYETMVFRVDGECHCGCGLPSTDGSELACRGYDTPKKATVGHMDLCQEYARKEAPHA